MEDHVKIFDTTLRDGEQSPGATMTATEKLEIAKQLARLGVDIIEAGFPAASVGDWEAVNAIAKMVGTPDGPVIFDPAVYYGDREADLAMTELFGGFPAQFYSAYGPLPDGYQVRKHLYNLYHLLNHLNLFGTGYRAQVEATLRLLRDARL